MSGANRRHRARMEPGWLRRKRVPEGAVHGRCPLTPHKRKYPDEGRARAGAVTSSAVDAPPLYVYLCAGCRHWHLTKRPPR